MKIGNMTADPLGLTSALQATNSVLGGAQQLLGGVGGVLNAAGGLLNQVNHLFKQLGALAPGGGGLAALASGGGVGGMNRFGDAFANQLTMPNAGSPLSFGGQGFASGGTGFAGGANNSFFAAGQMGGFGGGVSVSVSSNVSVNGGYGMQNPGVGFAAQSQPGAQTDGRAAADVLKDNQWAFGRDGLINAEDLRRLSNGQAPSGTHGTVSPALQSAARHFLNNPDAFARLETAANGGTGKSDGLISVRDANTRAREA